MSRNNQPPTEREHEQQRTHREGQPPRPATEPKGSEHSTRNSKTLTDPATGAPADE